MERLILGFPLGEVLDRWCTLARRSTLRGLGAATKAAEVPLDILARCPDCPAPPGGDGLAYPKRSLLTAVWFVALLKVSFWSGRFITTRKSLRESP